MVAGEAAEPVVALIYGTCPWRNNRWIICDIRNRNVYMAINEFYKRLIEAIRNHKSLRVTTPPQIRVVFFII